MADCNENNLDVEMLRPRNAKVVHNYYKVGDAWYSDCNDRTQKTVDAPFFLNFSLFIFMYLCFKFFHF